MDALWTLLLQIPIIVALGYALCKLKVITPSFRTQLSFLLLNVTLPASVLYSGNSPADASLVGNLGKTILISIAYYTLALPIMMVLARALRLPPERSGPFISMPVFANVAFLGFPMVASLFGSEGAMYAVVLNCVHQFFLATCGLKMFNREEPFRLKKLLLNPLTITSLFAILMFISPLRVPQDIAGAFSQVGSMTAPLSLLIIGSNLAEIKFSSLWTNPHSYLVSLLRLFLFPFATLFLLWAIGLRGLLPATCVLLLALPVATINVMITEQHKKDVPFAAATALQSMVLMIVSLPVVLLAINHFLLV